MNINASDTASIIAAAAIAGTAIGFIVRGWSTMKSCVRSVGGFFVTTITVEDEATALCVLSELVRTCKRSGLADRNYGGRHESFRDGKFGLVPFENFNGKRILFWRRWWPVWYSVQKNSEEKKGESVIYWNKPKDETRVGITFFRGTVDFDKILTAAAEQRNRTYWDRQPTARRFFIKRVPDPNAQGMGRFTAGTGISWFHEGYYRLLAHRPDELGKQQESKGKAVDQLFFPQRIKDLVNEIELWRERREWYAARGIPWKRGWVLYGPPGTGKSAIVRAIAEDLDMPLFVYSLGRMLNEDLERSWAEMQAHVPCVALIEDFDNVFHGRQNIYGKLTLGDLIAANTPNQQQQNQNNTQHTDTGKLSFDCLLNCLDGVDRGGGVFTVITTNHIDKLDPALGQPQTLADGGLEFISTRPGRIDKAIELGHMTNDDKLLLARRIFFDSETGMARMRDHVRQNPELKETPAQFQERCAQLALRMLWEEQHLPATPPQEPELHLHEVA